MESQARPPGTSHYLQGSYLVAPNTLCGFLVHPTQVSCTLELLSGGEVIAQQTLELSKGGGPVEGTRCSAFTLSTAGVTANPVELRVRETQEVIRQWEEWGGSAASRSSGPWKAKTSALLGERVMLVAPHADDEVLTFGGTLARHIQNGDEVQVVIVTCGAWHGGSKETRWQECLEAARVLGLPGEPILLDLPDGQLSAHQPELGQRLLELMREHQPTLVYTSSPVDWHADHVASAHAVAEAIQAHGEVQYLAYGEFYTQIQPNMLVDITSTLELKLAAARCYRSQLAVHSYDLVAEGLSRYRALPVTPECLAAEAYTVLAVQGQLPLVRHFELLQQGYVISEQVDAKVLQALDPAPAENASSAPPQGASNFTDDQLPEIDVTIVTYNSAEDLRPFLDSLRREGYPLDKLHLYFVDHSPSEDTMLALEAAAGRWGKPFGTFHYSRGKNDGFAAGQNRAVAHGKSPFVLVTNIDLQISPGSLRKAAMKALLADAGDVAWEFRQLPYEHPKLYDPVNLAAEWVSGACVLLRRTAYQAVRGFDETYFLYCEDTDLSYRLRAKGWVLRYCPDCTVIHHAEEDADKILPQHRHMHLSNFLLRLRYGTFHDVLKGVEALAHADYRGIPARQKLREWAGYAGRSLVMLLGRPQHRLPSRASALRLFDDKQMAREVRKLPKPVDRRMLPGIQLRRTPKRFKDYSFGFLRKGYAYRADLEEQDDFPIVSIIVRTTGARPGFLREALLSLAHQTYPNLEVVLVEDGSELSRPVVEEFRTAHHLRILYIPQARAGRSAAGNLGLACASGTYIGFLDDDDLLFADHVEVLARELAANPQAPAAFARAMEVPTIIECVETPIYREGGPRYVQNEAFSHPALMDHNLFTIQAVLFRRSTYQMHGGFDIGLHALEDWDLWIRYSKAGAFAAAEKATSAYRIPGDPAEQQKRHLTLHEAYDRVWQKHHPGMTMRARKPQAPEAGAN